MALKSNITGPAKAMKKYGPVAQKMAEEEFAGDYADIETRATNRARNIGLFNAALMDAMAPYIEESRKNLQNQGNIVQGLSGKFAGFGKLYNQSGQATAGYANAQPLMFARQADLDRAMSENQASVERAALSKQVAARRNELLGQLVNQLFNVQTARFDQERLVEMMGIDKADLKLRQRAQTLAEANAKFNQEQTRKEFDEAVRRANKADADAAATVDWTVSVGMVNPKTRKGVLRNSQGEPILNPKTGKPYRFTAPKGDDELPDKGKVESEMHDQLAATENALYQWAAENGGEIDLNTAGTGPPKKIRLGEEGHPGNVYLQSDKRDTGPAKLFKSLWKQVARPALRKGVDSGKLYNLILDVMQDFYGGTLDVRAWLNSDEVIRTSAGAVIGGKVKSWNATEAGGRWHFEPTEMYKQKSNQLLDFVIDYLDRNPGVSTATNA